MNLPCPTLPLTVVTTLTLLLACTAIAQESQAPTAASAASTPAAQTSSVASISSTPGDGEVELSYERLMKQTPEARRTLLDGLPTSDRDRFLVTLPGDRRAVLMVDPEDCGTFAQLKRRALATLKPSDSLASSTVQDIGQSLTMGAMNRFAPGLGNLVSGAARINELHKLGQEQRGYVDVCYLSPDDKTALLSPPSSVGAASNAEAEPQATKEEAFLDRASRFFAR